MASPRSRFQWFYATRALGVVLILYGLVLDKTGERGTILLGGFGLLGLDRVTRSEGASPPKQ